MNRKFPWWQPREIYVWLTQQADGFGSSKFPPSNLYIFVLFVHNTTIIVDERNHLVKHFVHPELFRSYNNEVVVVICFNGTTQEINGRHDASDGSDQRERLGGIQRASTSNGTNPFGINQAHCTRENSHRSGGTTISLTGKILQRLKLIESEHLSFIQEHQQYLEARLEESKQKSLAFKQLIKELEQELYSLFETESKE